MTSALSQQPLNTYVRAIIRPYMCRFIGVDHVLLHDNNEDGEDDQNENDGYIVPFKNKDEEII